ncbi:hypothetical protein SASPL_119023 [Salvia splendens]|uniref:SAM domain-containing protein n=1 Tax=Salvia splendens TaxID=180675 RepID=A0A8X8XXT9_SALSN|nr:uncharacterized protein LOC121806455 [Salvia splendens]KAG6422451.1 hypothetical protein SASPL_119023 [Salvia splendens]
MATEHQQPDAQIPPSPLPSTAASAPLDPPPLDNPTTAAAAVSNPPKRQRRPSVRLGEIGGDPPYDAPPRRPTKTSTWRFHKDPSLAAKTSKTRPLTNLVNGAASAADNFHDSLEIAENFADFGHRKPKVKKPTKRARTNWNKFDHPSAAHNGGGIGIESTSFLPEENDNSNDEFREFEGEGSESPNLKEQQQSPINSAENMGLQFWDQHRRGSRAEINGNEVNSPEKNNGGSNLGVREWLVGLGLGRYAPVFEIHEVDGDVLPMLTLEDLKDMGINAVGSRRKMYSSILKLRKGFS